MLCPKCLNDNNLSKVVDEKGRSYYICPDHPEYHIPVMYGDNRRFPRDVMCAVGFSGHGKTLYFAALFASFNNLSKTWQGFSASPLDDESVSRVLNNAKLFKKGEFPPATPKYFDYPAIIQFLNIPFFKNRFMFFYDTGGENFAKAESLIENATYVKGADTVLFFISLSDIGYDPSEMDKLLWTYINGLSTLGSNPKDQHLLVVLTKGDLVAERYKEQAEIYNYVKSGRVDNPDYQNIETQIAEMKKVSGLLKNFLREDIKAGNFLNLAERQFRSVEISIVSALGTPPSGDQSVNAIPKRIFDPILWVMDNSTGWKAICFRWKKRIVSSIRNPKKKNKPDNGTVGTKEASGTGKKNALIAAFFIMLLCISIYLIFFNGNNVLGPAVSGLFAKTVTSTPTAQSPTIATNTPVSGWQTINLENYGTSTFNPARTTAPLTIDMKIHPIMVNDENTAIVGSNLREVTYKYTRPDNTAMLTVTVLKKSDGSVLQTQTYSNFAKSEEPESMNVYYNGPYTISLTGKRLDLDINAH